MRKDRGPLRHRVHVQAKRQASEVVEKSPFEQGFPVVPHERGEVRDVVAVEPEALQKIDDAFQAAGDRVAAAERVLAEEQVERRLLVRAAKLPVAVGHRQFVEVRQEREGMPVHPGNEGHAALLS